MQRPLALGLLAASLVGLLSCGGPEKRSGAPPVSATDLAATRPSIDPALERTIGSVARLVSGAPQRVEGWGLVANLPDTGSGDMPPAVRAYHLDSLSRLGLGSHAQGLEAIQPAKILESRQVAPVQVFGYIPALAPMDTRFDLWVQMLPGSQATSLEHGVLWPAELKVVGLSENDQTSRTLARGNGPIFANPFLNQKKKAQAETPSASLTATRQVRSGRILNGGRTLEPMPVVLQLYSPSYRFTTLIQRVVNARFPGNPPYAAAQDDSLVTLRIPPEFRKNPRDFVDRVLHMYLTQEVPGFVGRQTEQVLKRLDLPEAPGYDLSLALVGLGRSALPLMRTQYVSPDPRKRFYVAKAGATLSDAEAGQVLQDLAFTDGSPYQVSAIEALGSFGDSMSSTSLLGKLLSHANSKVRLAAYHALNEINSPAVFHLAIGARRPEDDRKPLHERKFKPTEPPRFWMDLVRCEGPPLIYATQIGEPRIAIFCEKGFELPPGLLYVSPDRLLTIDIPEIAADAAAGSERTDVRIYYRGPLGDKSIQINCTRNLEDVLTNLGWIPDPNSKAYDPNRPFIGASYQRIVEILSTWCRDQTLPATFVIQPVTDLNRLSATMPGRSDGTSTQPASQPATPPAAEQ